MSIAANNWKETPGGFPGQVNGVWTKNVEMFKARFAPELSWGEGPARNSMGSNSRVRAVRAREELGWSPSRQSLIEEIETGCYAHDYP